MQAHGTCRVGIHFQRIGRLPAQRFESIGQLVVESVAVADDEYTLYLCGQGAGENSQKQDDKQMSHAAHSQRLFL